jgi:acetolactate synthase-1/2/3 large subunit
VHNLPIVDALGRSSIEMVAVRHEQGAVHAADGYARATGRLGVALTSTGPGAANAMGGLIEAYHASSRVLMITGQSETRWLDKGRSTIHEFPRQLEMLRTVTRRSESVAHRSEVFDTILDVARDILGGRPRPGAVEIPIDLQYARAEHDDGAGTGRAPVRVTPDPSLTAKAAEMLGGAARPLIWAGGGVVSGGASAALTELAEALGAPVLTSVEGRGAIAEDHPLALGPNGDMAALDPVIAAADVVLAVGTRFQLGSNLQMALSIPGALIHVDADPGSIDRFHPVDLPIVGDADLAMRAILASLPAERTSPDSDYTELARAARRSIDTDGTAAMGADMQRVMADIIATIAPDDVVVKDSTVAGVVWANRLLPVRAPRTSMRPVSSSIGPGLPMAIGAAIGSERRTVVIQGDGGFMLSIGELATAVQYGAPVVVCVFNDRGYGILRWIQDLMLQGRRAAVDLQTPDFAGVAKSMGKAAWSVSSSAEFGDAFRAAYELNGPALLDIDITGFEPMRIVPQAPSTRGRRAR